MSRIEMSASIESHLSPIALVDRVISLAQSRGIKVSQVSPNQVDFRRGSQAALRLKGGMFSKINDFPVVAVLRCDAVEKGSIAVINSLDELGYGIKFGMGKKYNEAVQDFGEVVAAMVIQAGSN